MTTPELVEWQIIDPDNGMVMPWFTHDFLKWMKAQDWKNKTVLMFGAGMGDAWLGNHCRLLYVVERNREWLDKAKAYCDSRGITNVNYIYRPVNDCEGRHEEYLDLGGEDIFDVIINDDAYRTECCQMAVDYFTKRDKGGIFICDNWVQSFVWLSPKAEEIMKPYEVHAFEQKDHTNNDGVNKWKTVYWEFPAKQAKVIQTEFPVK